MAGLFIQAHKIKILFCVNVNGQSSSSDIKIGNQKLFDIPFAAWYKNLVTSHKHSGSWSTEKPACGN